MAARNVSGMNTFGAIQSTLNVIWSFIGVALNLRPVWSNPKRNVPIATIGGVLIAPSAMCFLHNGDYGDDLTRRCVCRPPFGDAARMALGITAGAVFPSVRQRVAGLSRVDCCRSNRKAAADDGLFPPIFARAG